MLHVSDAVKEAYSKIQIHTVDTDVLVLAILAAQRVKIPEVWVALVQERIFDPWLPMRC